MLMTEQDTFQRRKEDEYEDDALYEEYNIQWSDLIFLPFNRIFKLIVIICVIHKIILGPLDSVFGLTMNCTDAMDYSIVTSICKNIYKYPASIIYFIDTLLHILHRQVTDKAVRREYLPKSAFLILLDVVALIPYYELLVEKSCSISFYPNILCFSEFLIVYRIVEYFELTTTHIFWKQYFGFTILVLVVANCMTCFLLLLTYIGMCADCPYRKWDFLDWRKFILYKSNETNTGNFTWYFYGFQYMFSFIINYLFEETKPATMMEYLLVCIFMVMGYSFYVCVVFPKLFAESTLTLRRICTFHPFVQKLIHETKRRNASPNADVSVKNFYNLIWMKRRGIIIVPEIMSELPRYLRLDIREDLVWPVFYHSPTLRKTSNAFKRYLCDFIHYDYKLPGEKLFSGPNCHTNLYYLKSGIVQLISADDGITSLISMTSGTILGDIGFYVPPFKRKISVKCLTYCEILYVTRQDLLKCLNRYPEDKKHVFQQAEKKMHHAKTLYSCKQNVKGLDRAEDEGMDWLKRRWWEISDCVEKFKQRSKKIDRCTLPPEESIYHCAKYIGQLVLSTEAQLRQSSLFISDTFPWILAPNSVFTRVWHNFIVGTVLTVLIIFPPNISSKHLTSTFITYKYLIDFIYIADIFVSLFTSVDSEEYAALTFSSIMLLRFKRLTFVLDILAALWIEYIAVLIGKPEYYHVCLFNRLLKIYVLFPEERLSWRVGQDHMLTVYSKIIYIFFAFMYLCAFIVFVLTQYISGLSASYFFGNNIKSCDNVNASPTECALKMFAELVLFDFVFEHLYSEAFARNMVEIFVRMLISYHAYIIFTYCTSRFIAYNYLKLREIVNYQRFAFTLENFFWEQNISEDLMSRLNRYLVIHWKYDHGMEIMRPDRLKAEPYDIFWKVQGETAERIISQSALFDGADSVLIRELACVAKFVIIPKHAILFLFGVTNKNVVWIVQGEAKSEYHNEEGEIIKKRYGPGNMLSASTVFGKPSFRSYISNTDCEILYISIKDFHKIMQRHPQEWKYLMRAKKEYQPTFKKLIAEYVRHHAEHHHKFRERLFQAGIPKKKLRTHIRLESEEEKQETIKYFIDPESRFIQFWMPFRALIVLVRIISTLLLGGGGAQFREYLKISHHICNIIILFDIIMKFFLAYYDERGIMITATLHTMTHYFTRGFLMDVIGIVPWEFILYLIVEEEISLSSRKLVGTASEFAQIYLLTGYLDYLANSPTVVSVVIKILKLQLVTILAVLAGSQILVNFCVAFTFDEDQHLVNMTRLPSCWMPNYIKLDDNLSIDQFHMIFAHSINLAQSSLLSLNYGKFQITEKGYVVVGFCLAILGVVYWYVVSNCVTLLVLVARTDTLFQHNFEQLRKFLKAERVENELIEQTMAHFSYWWKRTKGINIYALMFERTDVVLRQDLSYFLYKETFKALDTILGGGEQFQRQMASLSSQMYFLQNDEIMREMDLLPSIFIVHRGRVFIMQNDEKIAVLTKGSIFGQLTGTTPRPVKSTAIADTYTDILYMSIQDFDDALTENVREHIIHNLQSKNDFIATKKVFHDAPKNSIKYIFLRGRKSIKMPWMITPAEAHSHLWYTKWLYLAWLLGPAATAFIVMILVIVPVESGVSLILGLQFFDLVHLMHTISEYFTLKIAVVGNVCVTRRVGWRLFRDWKFYVNVFSLVVPMLTFITDKWIYQFARIARLLMFVDFHKHFCLGFKNKPARFVLNFIILTLLVHFMTCGWIYIACRGEEFPMPLPPLPDHINKTIDYNEWVIADQRKGGCARITRSFVQSDGMREVSFLVPRHWSDDYIVAFTFIILLHTHTVLDTVMQLTIAQVYYKIFIHFIIYLIDIWLISNALGFVYMKYRELYVYDYNVRNLSLYLQHSGLSPSLLRAVIEYTKHLWNRQKGNWMPGLAMQAPACLREDIFGALYLHHILTPPLFRQLPEYFTRQLVTRVHRSVIFPGKCLVQEGDITSEIFFIHEGEIEKWHGYCTPERRMTALLSTNSYFGMLPGLFPNTRYQFTYVSRTVVDLISLRLRDFEDLLTAYPDVKVQLYDGAKKLKAELKKEGLYM